MHLRPLLPPASRGSLGSLLVLVSLAGCGTTTVPPGPDAADPVCASIIATAPKEILGHARQETNSQGTLVWGEGEDAIVLRCGVEPPGPTTQQCTTLADAAGAEVDWIVTTSDDEDPEDPSAMVLFTTYGRTPAVDISVPRSAAPEQPSAVPLEFTRPIAAIPATTRCIGPGDAA
ncbi:DUF3515 family protein [Brachybacterium hainanense]|uniref:DUF3515 family protein n=1 Tax=Brachybacterium hainanense TaxID=1541174 RepID=A0ABV6RBU1_9MICO